MPLGRFRRSGSCVRLPVRTTRLMFVAAMTGASFASCERLLAFLAGQARVQRGTAGKAGPGGDFTGLSVEFAGAGRLGVLWEVRAGRGAGGGAPVRVDGRPGPARVSRQDPPPRA